MSSSGIVVAALRSALVHDNNTRARTCVEAVDGVGVNARGPSRPYFLLNNKDIKVREFIDQGVHSATARTQEHGQEAFS